MNQWSRINSFSGRLAGRAARTLPIAQRSGKEARRDRRAFARGARRPLIVVYKLLRGGLALVLALALAIAVLTGQVPHIQNLPGCYGTTLQPRGACDCPNSFSGRRRLVASRLAQPRWHVTEF